MNNIKNITVSILIMLTTIFAKASEIQVPNGNFESWNQNSELNIWKTSNAFGSGIGATPVEKTTDSYSGKFALKLVTYSTIAGLNLPGIVNYGNINIGYVSGGIPFDSKPDKLTGFFKHPSQGDSPLIAVVLTKYHDGQTDTVGTGTTVIDEQFNNYQQIETNIQYRNDLIPDTLNLILLSDQYIPGSTLYVDSLNFVYNHSGISSNNGNRFVSQIYPNPASDHINILLNDIQNNTTTLTISDIYGNCCISEELKNRYTQVDIQGLAPGNYIITIIEGDTRIYQIISIVK